ncbi:uncharacterized protein TM35_000014390 [Trypanosoma theileri]|uniref:Uncharacterized protein n=1 Tax=Trypanosoma theileri TaxID=67003 RepID=A0A1X0P9G2_9TRYP|nr:uncharacterized protein TM35_000014390 [Trypanosoma theileri]ORC93562.1 hypothetical protein TM35_000014390 [Trypanosoma theileri]
MFRRYYPLFSLKPVGVFPNLNSAFPTLREVCEKSGTPKDLVEEVLEQIREAELHDAIVPHFEITCVRVYSPPPLEDGEFSSMVLFRGTPDTNVEKRVNDENQQLYFSSSLRVALPYGQIQENDGNYRITLCRVARRPGRQLFNKAVASEDDLKLLDSVQGDMNLFSHAKAEQCRQDSPGVEPIFDGVVDWIDDGASYCFDSHHARMHTILSIDTRC